VDFRLLEIPALQVEARSTNRSPHVFTAGKREPFPPIGRLALACGGRRWRG